MATKETYGFEENFIPSNISSDSCLKLSNRHYKQGNQSLVWEYTSNSILSIECLNKEITKSKPSGMEFWIYNEKVQDVYIEAFATTEDKDIPYFKIHLDFIGWRSFWVNLYNDAGIPHSEYNKTGWNLKIIAPSIAGILYWDDITFTSSIAWLRNSDPLLIIKNKLTEFKTGSPWRYTDFWYSQSVPDSSPFEWNDNIADAFDTIAKRYDKWIWGSNDIDYEPYAIRKHSLDSIIANGVKNSTKYNVQKHEDGTITGQPLYTIRANTKPQFCELSKTILLQLALDYKFNGIKSSLDTYFLLLEYMHDQGWYDRSALGTLDHEMLRHAGYFHSIYILRNELREKGLLERELETAKWYSNYNEIFSFPDFNSCTADFMRTFFMYRLLIILALDDGAEKARDMHYFIEYVNHSMQKSPGFLDVFKPDGIGYHHSGPYMNSYAPNAIHMASVVTYLLRDTIYAVAEDRVQNLLDCITTFYQISCKFHIPYSVCGRMPDKDNNYPNIIPATAYMIVYHENNTNRLKQLLPIYKYLYKKELPILTQNLFSQASSTLEYFNTLGAIDIMKEAENIVAIHQDIDTNQELHVFKPYAGISIHKRKDWTVTCKGWSSYIWDYEGNDNENVYGHFISRACTQFFTIQDTDTSNASGYKPEEGWDWSHIPGTTTPYLQLNEMFSKESNNYNLYQNKESRNLSSQWFLGGVSHNQNGIFGNKIYDMVYDTSSKARKSVFFLDDLIVCLGDGINNNDTNHETHTTLFQISENNHIPSINGSQISKSDKIISIDDECWIEANDQNIYYIPKQTLQYSYQLQHSIKDNGDTASQGNYFKCWINHGYAPQNTGYEYAVYINKSRENIPIPKEYSILQKDEHAHSIQWNSNISMVIWNPDKVLYPQNIFSVSSPCILWYENLNNQIKISISDPNLRRPICVNFDQSNHEDIIAPAQKQTIRIVLNGDWKLEKNYFGRIVSKNERTTLLELACINGESYTSLLTKL